MKTVYQACDGKLFELRGEATEHEDELFDSWLNSLTSDGRPNPFNPPLSAVVHHFSDSHHLTCEGDNHMTPWDRLKESLRMYWDDIIAQSKHKGATDE